MTYYSDAVKFHEEILNTPATAPNIIAAIDMADRLKFLQEEVTELAEAHIKQDLVGIADALADIVYVALGTAHLCGLPFDEVWAAVQKANMAKVRGMTKRNMACDAAKPEGWVGPEAEIEFAIAEATMKWKELEND